MIRILAYMALAVGLLPAANSDLVAVRFGRLWDGDRVIDGALVVIEHGRIRSVSGGNPPAPEGAQLTDWSSFYGLPGMIDVHTHMTYYWDRAPGTRPLGQQRMPAVTVFLAQENARKTLQAGVTTVRDLGAQDYMDIAMRDLINRGAMPGPRMLLAVTDSRCHDGLRNRVQMYGSVGGFDNVGTQQTFTFGEMRAAVETAHTMESELPYIRMARPGLALRSGQAPILSNMPWILTMRRYRRWQRRRFIMSDH